MEFRGTPGPWVRESAGRGIGPVSEDDDQSYGMVIPVAYVDFGESDEVQNANARLIAAAPELLTALQLAEKAMAEGRNVTYPDWYGVMNKARVAISKALGEA
ncbi:hypothetical protein [Atlantibacter hermannii]|uniref:hypothetical protein n=1 Tax=Atlantibacter hermannii TaxID=565 RepID=UPI002898E82B|nr:hypothetical protein [Atlantibacter hermannii]